jgi:cellulose synthase/poly-beta-1,6-N-acetylglucosamine synthase-like glycosyltransferase
MSAFFTVQALIFLLLYFLLILSFFIGWLRTKRYKPDQKPPAIRVSIIIPCRNEAENIPELAGLLRNQQYPGELMEIIWIDDHSTDATYAVLGDLIQSQTNMHMVRLDGQISGKKAALKAGMELASGGLILLTDADSRPGTRWVQTMAKFFEDTGNDLILGPVVLDPASGPYNQIQKLEYLSLVASSVGASGLGQPVMAQGPNIAVRAADYLTIVINLDNRFASGDDVFLLQAMKKIPGKKIGYVLNPDAIVRSKPAKSLSGFLLQRRRWASKAKGYSDPFLILTTLLVFAANLEILAALIFALFGMVPIFFVLILFGIKTLADFPLLITAMKFFHCTSLLLWLIPVQALYPIYISVAGILSQVAPIRWRG